MTKFIRVESDKFAVYHTVYTDSNIFLSFEWDERINDLLPEKNCFLMYKDNKLIGGFTQNDNTLSYPFIVPPFNDRREFWDLLLKAIGQREVYLTYMPESDSHVLMQSFGAELKWSQRRMIRPTGDLKASSGATPNITLRDGFCFKRLEEGDIPEIVQVVCKAHSSGYTATVWEPDMAETEEAIRRRFKLFSQTDTLYMGNIAFCQTNREIAGVCIAGVYPDSPNNFATIHQVSVKPEYRRMGIAEAMMLKSISDASSISPVMTLGVLIGNPAEVLYSKIGFAKGPAYSELTCVVSL